MKLKNPDYVEFCDTCEDYTIFTYDPTTNDIYVCQWCGSRDESKENRLELNVQEWAQECGEE